MPIADDAVSFARDIRPLFRQVDLDHMDRIGVKLDDYEYMSDPSNAQNVYDYVAGTKQPRMPPGGPFWDEQQLDVFSRWVDAGCPP